MVPGNQDWDRALALKQKEEEEEEEDKREGNWAVSKANLLPPFLAMIRVKNLIDLSVVSLTTHRINALKRTLN